MLILYFTDSEFEVESDAKKAASTNDRMAVILSSLD